MIIIIYITILNKISNPFFHIFDIRMNVDMFGITWYFFFVSCPLVFGAMVRRHLPVLTRGSSSALRHAPALPRRGRVAPRSAPQLLLQAVTGSAPRFAVTFRS